MLYENSEKIAYVKAQTGISSYLPSYDVSQGVTAWKFSDLAIRHGYYHAFFMAELVRDRVYHIPEDCTLLTSFRDFQEIEKETQQEYAH